MRISDWSSDLCSSDLLHGGTHDLRVFAEIQLMEADLRLDQAHHFRGEPDYRVLDARHRFGRHRTAEDRPRRFDVHAAAEHQQMCARSEEHTSELQSLMRISYAVFCLNKKQIHISTHIINL